MSEEKVVEKKRNIFPFIAVGGVIFLIIGITVTFIALYANSSSGESDLQKQLDLGEKYLSELNYEQAIVAYEQAIEIDPMSVEAYLGLSSVYVEQENYDKAISVLQDGYVATEDEVIKCRLDELTERISNVGEGDSEIYETPLVLIDDSTYALDLTEEETAYLDQLITLLEECSYEQAIEYMDYDISTQIAQKGEPTEDGGKICCYYKDRIILIHSFNFEVAYIDIRPIESGMGYYVINMPIEEHEKINTIIEFCTYGKCENGMYNGEFESIAYYEGDYFVCENGTAVNNLLHGDLYSYYPHGRYIDKETYLEGRLVYSDLGLCEGDPNYKYSYVSGVRIHEDGEESNLTVLCNGESIEQIKVEIESDLYAVNPLFR